jgi:hypothetical protein
MYSRNLDKGRGDRVAVNARSPDAGRRMDRADGMAIATQAPWKPWGPRPLVVKPRILIISAWEWLRRKLGYRHDTFHGSFGGVVPPSSG